MIIYITSTARYGCKNRERKIYISEMVRKVNFKRKQPWVALQCVIISLSAVQMVFACLQLLIHTPKLNNKQYLGEEKKTEQKV